MNDWSPGYEPDGISWLPYLAKTAYCTIIFNFYPNIRHNIGIEHPKGGIVGLKRPVRNWNGFRRDS